MDEPATDERAALKELERLQEQIQRYRSQRKAVDEQFEQFVSSFKRPREGAEPIPPPPAPPPRAIASPPRAVERVPEPPPARQVEPLVPSEVVERSAAPPPAPAPVAKPQARPRTGLLVGGALTLLAGSALVTWTLRPRAPESSSTGTATPIAPQARPAPERPPVTPPAVPDTALTTSRAVWVRVIADGERVLERELPGNARVPLKAEKSIVIRTGDAGAISLTIRGRDQGVLGRAGEVATRTFTVPARQ